MLAISCYKKYISYLSKKTGNNTTKLTPIKKINIGIQILKYYE